MPAFVWPSNNKYDIIEASIHRKPRERLGQQMEALDRVNTSEE